MTAQEYGEALNIQNANSRILGEFFTHYDLILSATTNETALPLGLLDHNDSNISAADWPDLFHDHMNTTLFNQTGVPAISLPLGQSKVGMPIGVQLAADMCQEALLIDVSAQLELAMPWVNRRPGIHAAA